jgi:hypothetical protein
MTCGLCGDIIPTEVARCPHCGAWSRRRDFRALGIGVFMLLGFNAFMALGSGISLLRLLDPLQGTTQDSYDPAATARTLAPYADVFVISVVLALVTGMLFVTWLWRAYGYSSAPGVPRRYGRGWVLGGWLLPIANLWVPPLLIHEVWVGSGRFRIADRHKMGLLVGAWWCSTLGSLGLMELFRHGSADTLYDARLDIHLGIAAAASLALAATLCMVIVFNVTRLQIGTND